MLVFGGSTTSEISLIRSLSSPKGSASSSTKARTTTNSIASDRAKGLGFTGNPAASTTKSGADGVNVLVGQIW